MMLRFDQGSTDLIDPATEQTLIDRLTDLFPRCDALIVSDYGYGILTPRLIGAIAELQAHTPRLLTVNSKHLSAYHQVGVTAVKPNYQEAVQLLGINRLEDGPLAPTKSLLMSNKSWSLPALKLPRLRWIRKEPSFSSTAARLIAPMPNPSLTPRPPATAIPS